MSYLDAIYSAIDNDDEFGALAAAIAGFCGTRSANLTHIDGSGALALGQMNYWRDADCAAYFTHYLGADPWRREMLQHAPDGRAFAIDGVLPPDRFETTAMYNDLLKVIGDDTARCAGIIADSGGGSLNIGIHRASSDIAFGPEDLARLDEVFVHVSRVLRMRDLLGSANDLVRLLSDMLDRSGQAMVLVDSRLHIRHLTAAAKAVLDGADGLSCRHGAVAVDDPSAAQRLRAAVAGAISRRLDAPDALLCPRRSGDAPYSVTVLPAGASSRDGAILLVGDPAKPLIGQERLQRFARIHALSSAETALVAALADGLRLAEIADRRGVTRETARTQLKHVFAKTGTSRQVELIRSLMLLPGS